jgi:hypothetical protein
MSGDLTQRISGSDGTLGNTFFWETDEEKREAREDRVNFRHLKKMAVGVIGGN